MMNLRDLDRRKDEPTVDMVCAGVSALAGDDLMDFGETVRKIWLAMDRARHFEPSSDSYEGSLRESARPA